MAEPTQKTKEIGMLIETAREELEAIKFYSERIDKMTNEKAIDLLDHVRKEEVEHLAEVLVQLAEMDGGFKDAFKEIAAMYQA